MYNFGNSLSNRMIKKQAKTPNRNIFRPEIGRFCSILQIAASQYRLKLLTLTVIYRYFIWQGIWYTEMEVISCQH